jgi:hypothetical protein
MNVQPEVPVKNFARPVQYLLIAAIAAVVVASALLMNFDTPYLAFASAAAFIFLVRSKPGRGDLLLALASAAALALARITLVANRPRDLAGFIAAMVGLGSFLLLGSKAVTKSGTDRKRIVALLGPALGLVFFIFSAQRALNLADLLYPKTFDLYLYAFDGSLGFEPSFLMGRVFHYSIVLRFLGFLVYQTIPLAMVLVYAGHIDPESTRPNWYLLELFFAAGLLGWIFYNFVPGTGPAYAFAGDFPRMSLPYDLLHRLRLEPILVDPAFPRNAIPSLHMTWILLLWWSCRNFSKWARVAALLYLTMTVVATLGTGEHYFIDLVVAVPFALMVESLCQSAIEFRKRLPPLLLGLLLTVVWLRLVRFAVPLMLKGRFTPWSLIVLSTGIVLWAENRFLRVEDPRSESPAAPEGSASLAAAASQ